MCAGFSRSITRRVRSSRCCRNEPSGSDGGAADAYGPEDLCATMYRLLGIDPEEEFYTPEGRPVKIVNNGRAIQELL